MSMSNIAAQQRDYKAGTRIERLTDWTIGIFNPKRRALRGHFRRFEADGEYRKMFLAIMSARGYRSAKSTTGATPWLGGNRSADAEILGDINKMASRQRELNRDDPMGSGVSWTMNVNVIGSGMRLQARTGDPVRNAILEAVFKERMDELHPTNDMSYSEAQKMKFHKWIEDGNCLVKELRVTPGGPLGFEVIEVDRLAMPVGERIRKGHQVRHGVESDAAGIRVAYWIAEEAPAGGMMKIGKLKFTRVPASIVKHLRFKAQRPGQTLGVPMGHAVLQDLRDIDLLILAALKRTQVAACIAAFIKSDVPLDEFFNATAEKYGFRLDSTIEPGMIWKLYPGEEIQSFTPNLPIPEFVPFVVMLAQRVGVALGISWQEVLRDFSKSSYSSMRGDKQDSRGTYRVHQHAFGHKLLAWEWTRVLIDERDRGEPRLRGFTDEEIAKVHIIPRGWDWVDPLKEAGGAKLELEMGTTTKQELCAKKGLDWEEVLDQQLLEEKTEIEKRVKMKLPPRQAPAQAYSDFVDKMMKLTEDEREGISNG